MFIGARVKISDKSVYSISTNRLGVIIDVILTDQVYYGVRIQHYTWLCTKEELILLDKLVPNTKLFQKLYPNDEVVGNFIRVSTYDV